MQSTALVTSIAILAALLGGPVLAADRDHGRDGHRDRPQVAAVRTAGGFDQGMQAVPHNAGPEEQGYGWRSFSDPAASRAVVISPQGDYYYSHGKGLRWVAGTQAGT